MSRLAANGLLLVTAALWGSSIVVQKFGMMHVGPCTFSAVRFLLAALVVTPLVLARRHTAGRKPDGRDWRGMILTGLVACAGAVLQQTGIGLTSVTNAGFLTGLYVPLVPLLSLLLFHTPPHPLVWPAVAASVLGTWLLTGSGGVSISAGDLWVIAGAFFWAIHVLLVGRVVVRGTSPLLLALVQFLVAALAAAVVAPALDAAPFAGLDEAWIDLLYVGVFAVGLGYTLQSVAQRQAPPADAAIILSSEVMFAAIGGAWLFGDTLSIPQALGCLAILAAMLAVAAAPLLPARRDPHPGR